MATNCTCERCGKKFNLKNSPDDAFCKTCVEYFDSPKYAETIMDRTKAAVAICNTRHGLGAKKMNVYAFLSIFHPKMTHVQKHKVLQAVAE
jgi:hypothetical protein